jgi:hypothetical protein
VIEIIPEENTKKRRSRTRPDMEERWAVIQGKLAAIAPLLARQGALVQKTVGGSRVWVVRFCVRENGRTVQRSLYVGTDDQVELLQRVRDLLRRYRAPSQWPKEMACYARFAASAHAAVKRGLVGSPDHRQRHRG